jgi:hypothetical protein
MIWLSVNRDFFESEYEKIPLLATMLYREDYPPIRPPRNWALRAAAARTLHEARPVGGRHVAQRPPCSSVVGDRRSTFAGDATDRD